MLAALFAEADDWSGFEVTAVIAAVLYLLLAIRQNVACWWFAALSAAIYVYLFLGVHLYMESVLNLFYLATAVYGWIVWYRGGVGGHELPVTIWPIRRHVAAVAAIVSASLATGYCLDRYTTAAFPYVDSLTTWAAIWTTFLVARKVLENWWYWLAIDLASIAIYWMRDLHLTALLFVVYVLMIPFGLVRWTRSWRECSATP